MSPESWEESTGGEGGNMFVCHKATCITEAATNSCHITHKQMDYKPSSKKMFCRLQYAGIFFPPTKGFHAKNPLQRAIQRALGIAIKINALETLHIQKGKYHWKVFSDVFSTR